ncbi:hypothetical protein M514_08484 [Trichuris suis]|uniref:Uncharacterized protein n=1 Tax=Trichuris suis TaxID=68888 RepID=A0A085M0D1_9BILA|nr:hypothetical protein M513_08484 [Trichuris suis]KFD61295.1 hypothetical protein M514_08484 [Trichuris suis]
MLLCRKQRFHGATGNGTSVIRKWPTSEYAHCYCTLSYILRMTINNVVEVWNDVSKQCVHHVWRKLIPDLICDFKDFVPYGQKPPLLDIIASVEHSVSSSDPQKSSQTKRALSTLILTQRFNATPSLSRDEITCLQQLKKQSNRIITKADKGNRVDLLDRTAYIDKMRAILTTSMYEPLPADPAETSRKKPTVLAHFMCNGN